MKKVRNLPTCFPTVLGFHDNSYPSVLPQQGSNRSVMGNGWWTIEETQIFTLACHWVLQNWDTHFASLCLTWLICPLGKPKCITGTGLLSLSLQVVSSCSP